MLTPVEKILFAVAVLASIFTARVTFGRMAGNVLRGGGTLHFDGLLWRLLAGLGALVGQWTFSFISLSPGGSSATCWSTWWTCWRDIFRASAFWRAMRWTGRTGC